jgi:N utilization substance protein B
VEKGRPGRTGERRHNSREQLVRALYQWQLAGGDAQQLIDQFTGNKRRPIDTVHFAAVLECVLSNTDCLDAFIGKYAVRSLEQLDAVGRAILLVALAELKQFDDIPAKVAINEAVDLAKRYGATDSYKFVNAVLDKAARELRGADK